MNLAIYGAQATALEAYLSIHSLYPVRKIECFLVTRRENNPEPCTPYISKICPVTGISLCLRQKVSAAVCSAGRISQGRYACIYG